MVNDTSPEQKEKDIFTAVQDRILLIGEVETISTLQEVGHKISSGDTVLLIDGFSTGLSAGTRAWESRAVATPDAEHVIRGPKEGFTETMRFNTALLRRRIKSTSFKVENFVVGRVTKTDTVVCYIDGIAPKELVDEVRTRISKIDVDGVLDTGLIEEHIEDEKYTIFAQSESTEKPDRVVGHLLEGRICIIVDGSPWL